MNIGSKAVLGWYVVFRNDPADFSHFFCCDVVCLIVDEHLHLSVIAVASNVQHQ